MSGNFVHRVSSRAAGEEHLLDSQLEFMSVEYVNRDSSQLTLRHLDAAYAYLRNRY